ncbi:unnamed protein product [Parnassius apollo]|uniref:3',5'-cyclic-GMP phosphodiesterase n=1 Tax=Parnassius apollo TaxID=110799 RepID=A0A8S3WQA9_PARAO|nr:unnamed protein product [Parnassius apollo]
MMILVVMKFYPQAIIKSFIGAMRSSFFIIDREHIDGQLLADMWDDGWTSERSALPRKKLKINLTLEESPAGLVARTGVPLNVQDAYRDARFAREIDPTTGMVVRTALVYPITDKNGVIGVVQLMNKHDDRPFDADDETIFEVFVNYCSLIVHFYQMHQKKLYHENLNKVFSELMELHLKPCQHDMAELMETSGIIVPPTNFRSFDFYIGENKEDMPGLTCLMYIETFAHTNFDRHRLADFVLTVLNCYRDNPYHNAEHAFNFTHTMYVILKNNCGFFSFVEDKRLMSRLAVSERARLLHEVRYAIMCTDLAAYFAVRAQLARVVAERAFCWQEPDHRALLKGILMTTSDLSGCCKPFGIAKAITQSIYEEFYNQGDRERVMGYTPLSMMDRKRSINQPAEQIQFLSVVVLPCLMLLSNIFPNTSPLIDNCRKTQEGWHEEIEMRGMKLWRQEDSIPSNRTGALLNSDSKSGEIS